MQVKCDYCDSFYDDAEEACPYCGGKNSNVRRTNNETPQTIEELQAYCEQNGFTAEHTRFFIGEDYRGARAFGIYKDSGGDFVVYKNKSDGSRAVRYQGRDEAYAVNEIYMRLQSEILNQKQHKIRMNAESGGGTRSRGGGKHGGGMSVWLFIAIIFGICVLISAWASRKNGYYNYNNSSYYRLDNTWYLWDDVLNTWDYASSVPVEVEDNWKEYQSDVYDYGVQDFKNTDFYSDWEESQSSSSDDSDWSSSDWDSDYTDWDSDW